MGRKKKLINLAKEHDFETEEQYLDYILESEINGQQQQVRELYKAMSYDDRNYFFETYYKNCAFPKEEMENVIKTLGVKYKLC